MTLEELTTVKVVADAQKIQYLYTLKHVIRYGQSRADLDYTESVAEHIWGMYIVAEYFRPLEDPDLKLDFEKVLRLITWHELGEIETGDIPAIHKTEADRIRERELLSLVFSKLPEHIRELAMSSANEYEAMETPEARFAKAIDKIEPLFHVFNPLAKSVQHELKLPVEISVAVKQPYIADYPYIKRFSDVLHEHLSDLGYFWKAD